MTAPFGSLTTVRPCWSPGCTQLRVTDAEIPDVVVVLPPPAGVVPPFAGGVVAPAPPAPPAPGTVVDVMAEPAGGVDVVVACCVARVGAVEDVSLSLPHALPSNARTRTPT